MLIVQSTSTCDVCLERYAWDDNSSDTARPHVITCGHVFCQQCLTNLRVPRTCPLCRASFHLARAVRIHVDLASSSSPTSPTSPISTRSPNANLSRLTQEESEARDLELKLVQAFSALEPGIREMEREEGEDSDEQREGNEEEGAANATLEQRAAVIDEVSAWLENTGASPGSYPVLRSLLSTLPSHHTLAQDLAQAQTETNRLRSERDHLKRYLRRAERAREQEAALAKSAEKGWLVRVSEIERDCELKLTQAETDRHRLEEELSHLKMALKESQAAQSDVLVQAHMQIREHDAQAAPPYSPRVSGKQQSEAGSTKSMSASGKALDKDAAGVVAAASTAGPSTSGVAFPRTFSPTRVADPGPSSSSASASSSAYATQAPPASAVTDLRRSSSYSYDFPSHSYSYSEDYSSSHNPLPRPPEPVPLSRLPAFARPKPGSSAYNAARTLARGGSLRRGREYSDRERVDRSEKERARAERKREKERERESRTDSEKDRRERRRERREREGGAATDSGKERRRTTGKDRYREKDQERDRVNGTEKNKGKGKEKERDRGTDTSTTETQDRARRRSTVTEEARHASLIGVSDSTSSSRLFPPTSSIHLNDSSGNATGNEEENEKTDLTAPRDVVGGWGLERSWRTSYASGSSGKSHSGASQEDLHAGYANSGIEETQGSNVNSLGSSYTKMRVRERLEKGEGAVEKGKERARGHRGEGMEMTADYACLPSLREERDAESLHRPSRDYARDPEWQRHVSFSTNPSYDSREQQQKQSVDTSHELPPLHTSSRAHSQYPYSYPYSSQGRERRTTLSAAPSALGLVLVPSPDGRGGYTYAYQYQEGQRQGYYGHAQRTQYGYPITLPPQSTIQTASAAGSTSGTTSAMGGASGKESVTPLASQTRPPGASASGYAVLSRRATDAALSAQAETHGVSAGYAAASQGQVQQQQRGAAPTAQSGSESQAAPLHVPQPRRISLTIPEPPESDTSPQARMQPSVQQSQQTQQQPFFHDGEISVNSGNRYPHRDGVYAQNQNQRGAGFYGNTNPSASMSLDSALASLSLVDASSGAATVDQSNGSAPLPPSSGVILQQHQQTLRHRTSNSSTASASTGISLTGATSKERRKQLLDALFSDSSERVGGSGSGDGGSNRSSFTSEEASASAGGKPTQGDAVRGVGEYRASQPHSMTTTTAARAYVDGVNQPSKLRGVPSRDGRPSRGLSPHSTRPSTTQPVPSATQTAADQNQTSSYYQSHTHHPQVLGSYASTYPTYQSQTQTPSGTSATAAVAAAYAAYSRYYNAQPQAQVHAQMHNAYAHAHAPPAHLQAHAQAQSQHAPTTTSAAVAAVPYRTATTAQAAAGAIAASGWSQDHRRY